MARSCPPRFNPNSEIKMAGMRQAVGAETVWKNRRPTRRGLVRLPLREAHNLNGQLNGRGWGSQFSKPFKPNRLMPTGRFNFGVRVNIKFLRPIPPAGRWHWVNSPNYSDPASPLLTPHGSPPSPAGCSLVQRRSSRTPPPPPCPGPWPSSRCGTGRSFSPRS